MYYNSPMENINQVVDSAFLRNSNYSYIHRSDREDLLSVLCFALARHRGDLILHQERIALLAKMQDRELLFTAIVDLFIALSDKGLAYRKRLLGHYSRLLSEQQSAGLYEKINQGFDDSDLVNGLRFSVLSLGLSGELLSTEHLGRI